MNALDLWKSHLHVAGKVFRKATFLHNHYPRGSQDRCDVIDGWKTDIYFLAKTWVDDKKPGIFFRFCFHSLFRRAIDLNRYIEGDNRKSKKKRKSITGFNGHDPSYEDKSFDAIDNMEEIKKAFSKLGEKDRKILALRYIEEKPQTEVAKELGFALYQTLYKNEKAALDIIHGRPVNRR